MQGERVIFRLFYVVLELFKIPMLLLENFNREFSYISNIRENIHMQNLNHSQNKLLA